MKLVSAYIKPHVLPDVSLALQLVDGFGGITILPARGLGWKIREANELVASEGLDGFEHAIRLEVENGQVRWAPSISLYREVPELRLAAIW